MYISEGTTAALATTAKSQQLFPSGQYHCAGPNAVETGEIDITGTAGDAFYAAQQ